MTNNAPQLQTCILKLRQSRKLLCKHAEFVDIVRDIDAAITSAQRRINKDTE